MMFSNFDGSGRTPRDVQKQALLWLEKYKSSKTLSMRLATGSGKSAIAMSVVNAYPDKQVCIVAPNNTLVAQYSKEYGLPFLIGKTAMSPEERDEARDLVLRQKKSFVTNSSWLLHNRIGKFGTKCYPDIVVLDEVDQIIEQSRNEQSVDFKTRTDSAFKMLAFLKQNETLYGMEYMIFKHAIKKSQYYFLNWREERESTVLHFTYLDSLVSNALKGLQQTILMSATLSHYDQEELWVAKNSRAIFDGDHPIPAENRPVVWEPTPLHYDENVAERVKEIIDIYNRHGQQNTLVHVTYEDQNLLREPLREAFGTKFMFNLPTKDSKQECVNMLHTGTGFLWLASGVSEGLDLKDDLCRVQIVPRLIFPYLGDEFVKKRLALHDGNEWYEWQALRQLIQTAGRCSRNPKDWGITYVLDNRLARFYSIWKEQKLLPKWFKIEGV